MAFSDPWPRAVDIYASDRMTIVTLRLNLHDGRLGRPGQTA